MVKEKLFNTEENGIIQLQAWNSIFGMSIQDSELNQLPNCLFDQFKEVNCENSMNQDHQMDLFENSIPIPDVGNDSIVLRELIGRLGSICNSSEISLQSCYNGSKSDSNSCYNSPQKLNQSTTDHQIHGNCQLPLAQFPTDPGFVERAAKFSTFSGKNGGIKEKSVNANERKRKEVSKGKGKETQTSTTTTTSAKDDKIVAEVEKEGSDAKRSKSNEATKGNEKSTDATKDYIHVRARRGQATDSHSLAERVRREKISERMKFLQDLVPGCNKVTGKAVMLDEIINYVRSLQQQVEFLSMKLATVDPKMDVTMEALLSKDIFRPRVSMTNNVNPFGATVQPCPYGLQTRINGLVPNGLDHQFTMNPLTMQCNSIMKPSRIHGFGEVSSLWENDLQSVVKMALGSNQPQGFQGQMKVEL